MRKVTRVCQLGLKLTGTLMGCAPGHVQRGDEVKPVG